MGVRLAAAVVVLALGVSGWVTDAAAVAETPEASDVDLVVADATAEAPVLRADAAGSALPDLPAELLDEVRGRPLDAAARERLAAWVAEARARDRALVSTHGDLSGSDDELVGSLSVSRELVSVTPSGGVPEGDSFDPGVSGDGGAVAFVSAALDLVDGTVGSSNVFLRLRDGRGTVWVSEEPARARGWSFQGAQPRVSADGRWVAYIGGTLNRPGFGGGAVRWEETG